MPQQRTKLIFGAPADGVGYVDDTAAAWLSSLQAHC